MGKAFSFLGVILGVGATLGLLAGYIVLVVALLGSTGSYAQFAATAPVIVLVPPALCLGGYISAGYSRKYPVLQGALVAVSLFAVLLLVVGVAYLLGETRASEDDEPFFSIGYLVVWSLIIAFASLGGYIRKKRNFR